MHLKASQARFTCYDLGMEQVKDSIINPEVDVFIFPLSLSMTSSKAIVVVVTVFDEKSI